jgi:hypothetical protein
MWRAFGAPCSDFAYCRQLPRCTSNRLTIVQTFAIGKRQRRNVKGHCSLEVNPVASGQAPQKTVCRMRDNSSGASVMRFVTAERQMCRDFAKDQLLGSANQVATRRCSNGKASPILSGTTGYASCLRYKDTGRHQKLVLVGHYADNANT